MDEVERELHSRALKGIAVGLAVGLALGILIGYVVLPPHLVGSNQVQVSGIVSESQNGEITFSVLNETENIISMISIVNGQYNVSLVSGKSYDVTISTSYNTPFFNTQTWYYFSLYVPLGVKNFTANF